MDQMPIQAFQRVRSGQREAALTPALYALRADGKNLYCHYPADGAVALPSYICARQSVPLEIVQVVLKALLTTSFSNYFVEKGDLVSCLAGTKDHPWVAAHGHRFLYPSAQWLDSEDAQRFYPLYESFKAMKGCG